MHTSRAHNFHNAAAAIFIKAGLHILNIYGVVSTHSKSYCMSVRTLFKYQNYIFNVLLDYVGFIFIAERELYILCINVKNQSL